VRRGFAVILEHNYEFSGRNYQEPVRLRSHLCRESNSRVEAGPFFTGPPMKTFSTRIRPLSPSLTHN
jgi:hypothetical protein